MSDIALRNCRGNVCVEFEVLFCLTGFVVVIDDVLVAGLVVVIGGVVVAGLVVVTGDVLVAGLVVVIGDVLLTVSFPVVRTFLGLFTFTMVVVGLINLALTSIIAVTRTAMRKRTVLKTQRVSFTLVDNPILGVFPMAKDSSITMYWTSGFISMC